MRVRVILQQSSSAARRQVCHVLHVPLDTVASTVGDTPQQPVDTQQTVCFEPHDCGPGDEMAFESYGGGVDAGRGIVVVTCNDLPGYRVDRVIGEVFGLTVRSRHLGSQIGAGLKSVFGGELRGLSKTLVESRNQAMERLLEQAESRGANAVLAMRYDVTEAGEAATEVCAYGTAVVVSPVQPRS